MGLFKERKKKEYIIIVGCGRLGAKLADTLSESGKKVLIIDNNERSFYKLSPSFGGIMMTGDATEIAVLNEANMAVASAVILVTNNDNTNILVAQIVKELFDIRHVIARLHDPDRECVYHEFNIDIICPAALSAKEIDKLLCVSNEVEKVL